MSKLQFRNHGPLPKKTELDTFLTLEGPVGMALPPTEVAMPTMAQIAISWMFGEAVRADDKNAILFTCVNFVGMTYKKNKAMPDDMEKVEVGYGKHIASAFVEAVLQDFTKNSTNGAEFVEPAEQLKRMIAGERFLYTGYFGGLKFQAFIGHRATVVTPAPKAVDDEEQQEPVRANGFLIELKVG